MELAPENNNEGDGSEPNLKLKVSDPKHKLTVEKGRFGLLQSQLELSMLVATHGAEKYKRECMCLEESVARLEQGRDILRERELKDQETVKNLLENIKRNEKELAEKMVELKMENWNLECAKRRLEEEICNLKEKHKEETEAQMKENYHVVESKGDSDADGDRVPISKLG